MARVPKDVAIVSERAKKTYAIRQKSWWAAAQTYLLKGHVKAWL